MLRVDKCTERACNALSLAQEEAQRFTSPLWLCPGCVRALHI
jgi:hypothetical protein